MDKQWIKLEQLTKQMIDYIDSLTMEQFQQFVDLREEIIERMQLEQISVEQKKPYVERVNQLLQQDKVIEEKMLEIKNRTQRKLIQLDVTSKQNKAYFSIYKSDSLFFDKKN